MNIEESILCLSSFFKVNKNLKFIKCRLIKKKELFFYFSSKMFRVSSQIWKKMKSHNFTNKNFFNMPLSGELYKYHFLPYHIVLDKVSDNFSCTSWYKVWREAEKYCAVALFTANRIQIDFWLHPFRYWLKFTVNLKIASIEAIKEIIHISSC